MSERPQRIQLSRRKGFNLRGASLALNGLDAVNCARPGPWGNPWLIGKVDSWHWIVRGPTRLDVTQHHNHHAAVAHAVSEHRAWVLGKSEDAAALCSMLHELRGRNLACWCALPKPGEPDVCHAATLLTLANHEGGGN